MSCADFSRIAEADPPVSILMNQIEEFCRYVSDEKSIMGIKPHWITYEEAKKQIIEENIASIIQTLWHIQKHGNTWFVEEFVD